MNLFIRRCDQRLELLKLQPQWWVVADRVAEGDLLAIAVRERPVHRPPIFEPELVFLHNGGGDASHSNAFGSDLVRDRLELIFLFPRDSQSSRNVFCEDAETIV